MLDLYSFKKPGVSSRYPRGGIFMNPYFYPSLRRKIIKTLNMHHDYET